MTYERWTKRSGIVYSRMRHSASLDPENRLGALAVSPPEVKKMLDLVDEDFHEIEAALAECARGNLPDGYEDLDECEDDLQRARLSVLVVAFHVREFSSPVPSGALAELGKALQSAATGSGTEHKMLVPPKLTANSKGLADANLRAKAAALHTRIEGDSKKVGALYDALAALTGLPRPKVRKMIEHIRGGQIKDETIKRLQAVWHDIYSDDALARHSVDELLRM